MRLTRLIVLTLVCLNGDAALAQLSPLVRVATYNVSLNFPEKDAIIAQLAGGELERARKVAAVIQRVRPDLLLINEFDSSTNHQAIELFLSQYLAVGQYGEAPIDYPHWFAAPVNTGVSSGVDLNGDGVIAPPNDAHGWGEFAGRYAMVVVSKFPLGTEVRTFQRFLWRDLPGMVWPTHPDTGAPHYPAAAHKILRLSSKSHWDLPIQIGDVTVHLLAAHPTPPAYDGPEDRNGLRNRDEIRFWIDYIEGRHYMVDDDGRSGGLTPDVRFVIVGDLNADPHDGDSNGRPAAALLANRYVQDPLPRSTGGVQQALLQGQANAHHVGDPALDTGDFGDTAPGNLRIDYVLPSANLTVVDSGVFWPMAEHREAAWVTASDHRLVWVDLLLPPR